MAHLATHFLFWLVLLLSSACTDLKMNALFPKEKPVLFEEQIVGRNFETRNYTSNTVQDCVIMPTAKDTRSRSKKAIAEQDNIVKKEQD